MAFALEALYYSDQVVPEDAQHGDVCVLSTAIHVPPSEYEAPPPGSEIRSSRTLALWIEGLFSSLEVIPVAELWQEPGENRPHGPMSASWRTAARAALVNTGLTRKVINDNGSGIAGAKRVMSALLGRCMPHEDTIGKKNDGYRSVAVAMSIHLGRLISPQRASACFGRIHNQSYGLTEYGEGLLRRCGNKTWPPVPEGAAQFLNPPAPGTSTAARQLTQPFSPSETTANHPAVRTTTNDETGRIILPQAEAVAPARVGESAPPGPARQTPSFSDNSEDEQICPEGEFLNLSWHARPQHMVSGNSFQAQPGASSRRRDWSTMAMTTTTTTTYQLSPRTVLTRVSPGLQTRRGNTVTPGLPNDRSVLELERPSVPLPWPTDFDTDAPHQHNGQRSAHNGTSDNLLRPLSTTAALSMEWPDVVLRDSPSEFLPNQSAPDS
jgi:hypothetical protein